MSSKIQGYVWDACAVSGVKGTKLMVLVRLADYSNDEGTCYPGIKTIARQIGAGESTIRTAISELEVDGWLRRENRRNGNRNTSNMYFLNVEKLEEIALAERMKLKTARHKNNAFHPSESDTSKSEQSVSDPSGISASNTFHPSESGKNNAFHPSESGGHDPQVLKHDPQVKDHESQEKHAKGKNKFDPATTKPENVSADVWQDWVKHRKEKRAPLTQTTCEYQANQLKNHQNADEVIRRSIAGGWQGLFPEKVPNQPPTTVSKPADKTDYPGWFTPSNDDSAEVFVNQVAIDRMKRGDWRQ